jgi:N-acetylglutamate synthase-like GNAT family acetyltransferase
MARRQSAVEFSEKEFYLDEFRGRTLLFAVHHDAPVEELRELGTVARDLLANDTRVLVLLGGNAAHGRAALGVLERALGAVSPTEPPPQQPLPGIRLASGKDAPVLALSGDACGAGTATDALLIDLWGILRRSPFFLGLCDGSAPERLVDLAQRIGARLRVHKLVIVDPQGGVRGDGTSQPLSFMDEAVAEQLLRAGEAEWAGLGTRRSMLDAIRNGLLAGIDSVNLCTLGGLARELFTYEGSGTLFTREDYVKVDRLSLDDFAEVEKLLERGQREGYLKPRSADEIARILVSGYGATIGRHHLAGVCSLQTEAYEAAHAGEIVGLYTITRFKSEGVGAKLVACMKAEGARLALRYLFACTTQDRVRQFFERQGFRRIAADEAPPEKWTCYDEARRRALAVYRFDLP